MRSVLARLPFTFLILGGWLAYEGYRASNCLSGPVTSGRITMYYLAALLAIALSMMAFRERHRPKDDDNRML